MRPNKVSIIYDDDPDDEDYEMQDVDEEEGSGSDNDLESECEIWNTNNEKDSGKIFVIKYSQIKK